MVTVKKCLLIYAVVALGIVLAGCTHTYTVPDVSLRNQGGQYSVDKKIDLTVNLCLTDELKASKWERSMMGDTFIIPIGNQLAKNASELSEILFKDVAVTSAPAAGGEQKCDAILTPRVVAIERTVGAYAFAESVFTVVLEWRLEDVKSNVIWMDSIKGEGRANSGNMFTASSNATEQTEMLLKDLFGKSLQAFRTSPEIDQFVTKKRNKGDNK